uniref:Toll-like receptor 22 n=1 Tax=Hucho hucho TaxID=62062 RepID=A0A4W5P6P5_9TELE
MTTPGRGSESFSAVCFCFLLYVWILVDPVKGYFLKHCRIYDSANVTVNMTVLCKNKNLLTIPEDIPSIVRSLDISINTISKIKEFDFKDLSVLEFLNMSSNVISHVEDGAFLHLVALQRLDLGYNELTIISDHMFRCLAKISALHLNNNLITTIGSSSFKSLSGLHVANITNNKLHCLKKVQPIIQLPNLQKMYIGRNGFISFQSREISNKSIGLRVLDVSGNPLDIFVVTASVLPNLQKLNLAYCGHNGSMQWDVADRSFLRNVSSLDMSGIHMSLEVMSMLLRSFGASLLESLTLSHLGIEASAYTKVLTNIACHINNISFVSEELLQSCTQLTDLGMQYNNMIDLSDSSFWQMKQLRNLELGHNMLSSVPKATRNLPTLEVLDLSFNRINKLGCSDFDLKSLKVLNIGTSQILALSDAFKNGLQKLEILDLRDNKLSSVRKEDFKSLQSLKELLLFNNQISSLEDGAFEVMVNLRSLTLSANRISQTETRGRVFRGLKRLTSLSIFSNHIKYETDDKLNPPPFSHLTSLKILQWGKKVFSQPPIVQVLSLKKMREACNFHHRYTSTMTDKMRKENPENHIVGFVMNLFSLDFLILANLSQVAFLLLENNQIRAINETVIRSLPDAFVSYNTHDEPWVLRELLPVLEGQQGWKLCLHHRDFQPGKPIIENITDAIYGSRKTICVISRHYLESEWCSREIQVASFHLFDEQKDVLILVFLEEIADQQLSPYHRTRRLLKRQTYLSWPRAGEYTGVFWQKLRVALETRDCPAEENPILTGVVRW